ncbi:protein starmaker-like [Bombus bifarius]|uniref:Protein starmaker-like n=1 Tax=Bombus bifarius TaxID=103933 RepID=A0A6P8N7Y6_9HYME|nr:protein starmaker-like [Bombus bifarius]
MSRGRITEIRNFQTAETGSASGRIESLFTAWKPITKIENATGLSKKMNKNSSKRISSITSPLRDGKINKHNTINTFTKPANNASINILNTTELKSDSNSNLLVEDKVGRSIKFNKTTSKNKVEIFETLNNHREWDTIERVKRSLDKKSNYVGFREQVPSSKRFYRHPGLSYEEQQNQLNHTVQTRNINQNLGSTMNKLLDTFESSQPETTIEYPSKEPSKHSYVPIFPSCDDTENFESNDSDNSTKMNVRNRSNDKVDFAETQEAKGLKTDRNVLNETFQDTNKLQSSVRQQRKDNSYIDIRDHQKSVENVTSSAIAEYNPNKIPYVEVPDYSDIREESLDERDRKENETRTDFVDPEVFADLKESAKSPNDSSEGSVKDKSRKNSRENLSKERESDLTNLDKFSDTDEPDTDKSKESNSNFTNFELSKNDELEENDKKNLFKDSKDDLNNANLKKLEWKENARGGNGEPQEDSEETGQGDSESKSGPIIFDINEYRKPFDLDEFLKDDPIMKKLNLLEKETRTKYGQNGKRVSTDFNESESDNTFRERANGRGNSKEVRDTFDDLPRSYKSSDFADMFAKIDEGNQNEGNKGKKGTESDNQESEEFNEENSDDDFLTIFKKDKEDFSSKFEKEEHQDNESEAKEKAKNDNVKGEDSVEENSNEDSLIIFKQNKIYPLTKFENEKVFPSGYLKNEENNRNVVDRRRKNNKYQEDTHDALSTILSKKSQVSRLDEDIDGRIEDGDAYKNFWSLEYKSPRSRVDMEAQERRK